MPGIRKAILSLSTVEKAKEHGRRALRVLRSFVSAVKVSIDGIEYGLSIAPEAGVADSGDLESDLPDLFLSLGAAADAAQRPIAIIIDELQYLSETEFSALIMAIHRITQLNRPIILIGAGLPQILGLAGESKSYAERLFKFPHIGALEEQDAINAIVNPANAEGVSFEKAAVAEILKVTERYPYFLQQWAHEAWNVAEGTTIRGKDVLEAHNNAIAILDESFFKVRFDRCTPSEKKYMRALAELGSGSHRSGDIATILKVKSASVAPYWCRAYEKPSCRSVPLKRPKSKFRQRFAFVCFNGNCVEAKRFGDVLDPDQKHGLSDTLEANQYRTLCRSLCRDALKGDVCLRDHLAAAGKLRWRRACARGVGIPDWVHVELYLVYRVIADFR